MKITSTARQQRLKAQKLDAKLEQDAIKARLADKYGDKFKAVKKDDATVVISKEAHAKADSAVAGDIGSNDPNSEETKEKIKGLLISGTFNFNDKERDALNEILG